jgi:hypothetical protein
MLFVCACNVRTADQRPEPTLAEATSSVTQTSIVALTPTPGPCIEPPGGAQPAERWIEVDLQEQKMRLHDSCRVVGEYLAATGVGDRPETTTYPGVFRGVQFF